MAQFNFSLRFPCHPLFLQPGIPAQTDGFSNSIEFPSLSLPARRHFHKSSAHAESAGNGQLAPLSSSISQKSHSGPDQLSPKLERKSWELNLSKLHEKYILDEFIGEGSFGKVYLARTRQDGAVRAIKIAQPKCSFIWPRLLHGLARSWDFEGPCIEGVQCAKFLRMLDWAEKGHNCNGVLPTQSIKETE